MENQQARDELIAELKRHGLPPAYIQRLLEELDDHLADMEEERSRKMNGARKPESTNTEVKQPDIICLHERLGDPAQLAALAAKQYHNRSFLGRHPILTFLALPLPLTALCIATLILVLYLTSLPLEWMLNSDTFVFDHPVPAAILATSALTTLIILPPLMAGLLLARIARRNHVNWRWYLAACSIIAIYCGNVGIGYNLPQAPPANGFIYICLGCIPIHTRWVLFHFLPKFAFAMTVAWVLLKRAQRLQKIDEGRQEINTSLRHAA